MDCFILMKNAMKEKLNKHNHFWMVLLALILFTACNKKSEDESSTTGTTASNTTTTGVATGRMMFHLHTYIGNTEVDGYNIVYSDENGRKISLQLAQFYVSNIQLVKLDGSTYDVPETRLLKLLDIATYDIGDVPAGNYQAVRFKIGLDTTTNRSEPQGSADSVILNRSEMWFGNSVLPDGYVFLHAKGIIDTTADASGNATQPFDYKIGTNAHRVQINMPVKKYSVLPGGVEYAHILVDYSKLFTGINLSEPAQLSVISATDNATVLGAKIAGNISSMFSYEE